MVEEERKYVDITKTLSTDIQLKERYEYMLNDLPERHKLGDELEIVVPKEIYGMQNFIKLVIMKQGTDELVGVLEVVYDELYMKEMSLISAVKIVGYKSEIRLFSRKISMILKNISELDKKIQALENRVLVARKSLAKAMIKDINNNDQYKFVAVDDVNISKKEKFVFLPNNTMSSTNNIKNSAIITSITGLAVVIPEDRKSVYFLDNSKTLKDFVESCEDVNKYESEHRNEFFLSTKFNDYVDEHSVLINGQKFFYKVKGDERFYATKKCEGCGTIFEIKSFRDKYCCSECKDIGEERKSKEKERRKRDRKERISDNNICRNRTAKVLEMSIKELEDEFGDIE